MATFRLPTFNLTARVWDHGSGPPAQPRLITNCQLRTKPVIFSAGSSVAIRLLRLLCVPGGTDIRGALSTALSDVCEVPAGSGRLYDIGDVDDVARGFINQYRVGIMLPHGLTPAPLP